MAYVFSPEIEAILAKGPPAIDWDGISDQLRRDFLQVCDANGDRVGSGVSGAGGRLSDSATLRTEVEARASECRLWSCLEGRVCVNGAVAVAPSVVVGAGALKDLVSVGKPWLTFSRESVAELNRMGVDEAYSVHGTVGASVTGAVVYRGSTDTTAHVNFLTRTMYTRLAGPYKYVTAWVDDASLFSVATAHLFSNGGRACGWSVAGASCHWCEGSGRVVHEYESYDSGSIARGAYCLCSRGDWLEVHDDEEGELEFGGAGTHLMGRPSGGTPSPRSASPVVVDLSSRFGGGSGPAPSSELYRAALGYGAPADGDDTVGPVPEWTSGLVQKVEADRAPVESSSGSSVGGKGGASSCVCCDGVGVEAPGLPAADPVTYLDADCGESGEAWSKLVDECVSPLLGSALSSGPVVPAGLLSLRVWSGLDLSVPAPDSVWDDGWCYLAVVAPQFRGVTALELGAWPTVDSVLDLPSGRLSFGAMSRAVCRVVAEGKLHVDSEPVGVRGLPLFDQLAGVSVRSRGRRGVGTFGELLKGAFRTGMFGGGVVTTEAHYVLGASGSGGWPSGTGDVPGAWAEAPWSGPGYGASRTPVGGSTLGEWLAGMCGHHSHAFSPDDLLAASSSAAMLPPARKVRLKTLEAVGDSALSLAVALKCAREGRSAEEYQNARSAVTSNPSLSALYVRVVPQGFVTVVAGVDPGRGKVGAYILEGWIGLICLELGNSAVDTFCTNLGLYEQYERW